MIPSRKPVAVSRGTKPVTGNSSFPSLHAVPNITSNTRNILQKFLSWCCGAVVERVHGPQHGKFMFRTMCKITPKITYQDEKHYGK
jgi:hypothetical protein